MYCELKGAKTVSEANDAPSVTAVIQELQEALKKHRNLDVITLTANGEPTLYPHLKELVKSLHTIKKECKLLILSNGSTILNPDIRTILSSIDIVKLSLDCVTPLCFKRLDRAHKGITIEAIIEGMKEFKKIYQGVLILEILVVEGINDTLEEFQALNKVLQVIQPNRIDVGTIDRPPAYDVRGVSVERLIALSHHLENLHVNITYGKQYSVQKRHFSEEEIIELLKRRPQSFEDVHLCFDEKSQERLHQLLESKRVHIKRVAGVSFYSCG